MGIATTIYNLGNAVTVRWIPGYRVEGNEISGE